MRLFNKGFTLIELMVAIAIFAAVFGILVKSEISSARRSAQNGLSLRALPIATEAIEQYGNSTIKGEHTEKREQFTVTVKQEDAKDNILPIQQTVVKVKYENSENAELQLFKIKLF